MRNAIFTICAKNYLAQAKTLGYSVKKHCPDVDFFILLSDEIDGINIKCEDFNVIESKNLPNIHSFYEMAFKYDVIEFSTSIKPYFLDILVNERGYQNVLYIDPDMVVYNSLNFLFDELETKAALLTPHILYPYVKYEGATSEEELLFVGIYNLGFFAVNNSTTGKQIIDWWKHKLADQCYADKEDAQHVDQRWMDFLPALHGDNVKILRHPGMNVAFWNMHERAFSVEDGNYFVDGMPLAIFHFSGLDAHDYHNIARKQDKYNLDNKPEYLQLFKEYVDNLEKNDLAYLSKLKYKYNQYDNGVSVLPYQRRFFRTLGNKEAYKNPFITIKDSFFNLLEINKLMIFDKDGKYIAIRKGISNVDGKIEKLKKLLIILKKTVGIKRYYLLMKFIRSHSRFEKQAFLIEKNS
ncbi:hypothetical protein [Pedobacter agri]|uniref:hypothetical protein n=1 Tax=Pedobacter agri TaxID=454586 RepID=UPI00292D3B5D|nr:hypothetical protein [Pedobacter agri]